VTAQSRVRFSDSFPKDVISGPDNLTIILILYKRGVSFGVFIIIQLPLLNLSPWVEMALLPAGGAGSLPSRKCFSFYPPRNCAIQLKSGTTRGACLLDVVYCSMCKMWCKHQVVFLIWWRSGMLFHFAFSFRTRKTCSSFGCFVKGLKPNFNLCFKWLNPRNCAKLLVSPLQFRNCVSKFGILINIAV
jgi:hypothetical protein